MTSDRPRQPKPGEEGGVRNNYDGPLSYVPEIGQYFDPSERRFIDISTGQHFDVEGYDLKPKTDVKEESLNATSLSSRPQFTFAGRQGSSELNNDSHQILDDLREKLKTNAVKPSPSSWSIGRLFGK
jgi:hypothetical protein